MVNCEICPSRDVCRINKSGECLPDLEDEIGRWTYDDFKFFKEKLKTVDVSLIVGGFGSCRRDEYDKNWRHIKPDRRWLRLYDSITKRGYINDREKVGFPVDLVEFEGKYYVARDGYRRVSIAKLLNIPSIKATVTKMKRKKEGQE